MPIVAISGTEAVAIEGLDILLGLHLPEIFVADAARGIARAGLFGAENGEIDLRGQQYLRDGGGNLLIAPIEGAHTANPVEHIGLWIFRQQGDTEALSPLGALIVADLPGVAIALNIVEERGYLGWEITLLHDQRATHIHNLGHMLNGDGADLHAGHTGGAGPERLFADNAADHRLVMGCLLIRRFIGRDASNSQLAVN